MQFNKGEKSRLFTHATQTNFRRETLPSNFWHFLVFFHFSFFSLFWFRCVGKLPSFLHTKWLWMQTTVMPPKKTNDVICRTQASNSHTKDTNDVACMRNLSDSDIKSSSNQTKATMPINAGPTAKKKTTLTNHFTDVGPRPQTNKTIKRDK